MTNVEIREGWERAERWVEQIWEAFVTGENIEEARANQKSLKEWLDTVKENRIVYNGVYDDFLALNLKNIWEN